MSGSRPGTARKKSLQLFKTDMCKFYQQGKCNQGSRCAYAHDPQEIRHKPDLTNTSMCKTFAKEGRCADPACRYAHSEVQLRATSGFFKMKMCGFWYNCKNGQNCRFAHSPEELRTVQRQQPGSAQRQQQGPRGPAPRDRRLGGIVEDQTQALPGAPGEEDEGGCDGAASSTGVPPAWPAASEAGAAGACRRRWSDVQDSSGSADQDGSQASSGSCPRAQSSNAVYHGQDGSDSSQGSVEGGSQEGPRSDHTSNHSGTTIFTGESGRSVAAGDSKGSPSGFCNSGDSADVTTGASSRDSVTKLKHKRRDADKRHDAEQAGLNLLADGTSTLHISNVPTYFTQGSLLAMLEDLTPAMRGNFDFFHCPWQQETMRNAGYATINFTGPFHALTFQQAWSNKELCRSGAAPERRLRITRAPLQGLQANLEHFSRAVTGSLDSRFRPLFRDENGTLSALAPAGDPGAADGLAPLPPPRPQQQAGRAPRALAFQEPTRHAPEPQQRLSSGSATMFASTQAGVMQQPGWAMLQGVGHAPLGAAGVQLGGYAAAAQPSFQ